MNEPGNLKYRPGETLAHGFKITGFRQPALAGNRLLESGKADVIFPRETVFLRFKADAHGSQ